MSKLYNITLTAEEIELINKSAAYTIKHVKERTLYVKDIGGIPTVKLMASLKVKTDKLINIINDDAN